MEHKISRGEVIVFTSGCYSNFGIRGYAIALKDFDMREVRSLIVKRNEGKDRYGSYEFMGWLVSHEYVLPIEHREYHLGDYELFDTMEIE